jgi:hypothetical protein
MKSVFPIPTRMWIALVLLMGICLKVGAQETNSPSRLDYPTFRLISERNIFNPNRSTRSARAGQEAAEKEVTIESFALVGTLLSDETGRFAFFEGTRSEYRKVLRPADTIAGYKIAEITPKNIKLEADGQVVELPVGMQMKRPDQGEWQVAARAELVANTSRTIASSENGASAEKTEAGSDASAGGGESDVLKRLMQKREQEIKP